MHLRAFIAVLAILLWISPEAIAQSATTGEETPAFNVSTPRGASAASIRPAKVRG